MGDREWTISGCGRDGSDGKEPVWWYGIPGSGSYYWTARYGQYWVGGGLYQKYAQQGYECGAVGAPVKEYQWLSEFNAFGQWFEFGAIYYSGGQWRIALGNYGQTAGRLAGDAGIIPPDVEVPPDPPVKPKGRAPGMNAEMRRQRRKFLRSR